MRKQVTAEGGDADDQAHLAFALGKALEDLASYDESFKFYRRGNAIRRVDHRHNPKINVLESVRQVRAFDAAFFEQRKDWGCQSAEPIFIVGLPRAGSTLLEQILASHSQVEGTTELQDIIAISRKLGDRSRQNPSGKYPEIVAEMTAEQFLELGESYLETTRIQRSGEPFFIDKMPNNFRHIGLIHLILPNSKIIDARRHPMGGCFSGFKQLFANGQTFTYGLEDIGKYYRDYVRLMDHWDAVLPGRVHRVQYEDMVSDTEAQIRTLLDYCKLDLRNSASGSMKPNGPYARPVQNRFASRFTNREWISGVTTNHTWTHSRRPLVRKSAPGIPSTHRVGNPLATRFSLVGMNGG